MHINRHVEAAIGGFFTAEGVVSTTSTVEPAWPEAASMPMSTPVIETAVSDLGAKGDGFADAQIEGEERWAVAEIDGSWSVVGSGVEVEVAIFGGDGVGVSGLGIGGAVIEE